MKLSHFKRLDLFARPTPLHELPRLQRVVGCKSRIFIKRDDLTGVGLGGNKVRKLCYVMAEAIEKGADTIITWAGVQSNHCRQTLAIARQLGMECHLVLEGKEPEQYQGNTLIFSLLGAKLHFVGHGDGEQTAVDVAKQLSQNGKRPFIVPIGASTPLGSLGYVESVAEVTEQAHELGVNLTQAFLATGSAGTQAGAEIGAREYCPWMTIHGISVSRSSLEQKSMVANLMNETYRFLGLPRSVGASEISVHDEYYEEYAKPTRQGINAIRLLAESEGILLDPVYTGKAMAGMISLLNSGSFSDDEAILFFHTGGSPALFAYADIFCKPRE